MKNKNRIICIFFCMILLCVGCGKREKIANPESYETILDKMDGNSDIHSKLLIFPEPEMVTKYIKDCNYTEQEGIFDGTYQLSIICDYDNEIYEEEKQRLGNITVSYNGSEQSALCTNTESGYSTYITIYDHAGTYEYAMLDDKSKTIIYVFSQLGSLQDIVDEKYVIDKSAAENEVDSAFNIYYFPDEEGDGYSFIDE